VFGKKFSEYIQFQRWILILIAAVFIIRLVLPFAGLAIAQARWISINAVLLIALVYCSIAVHTSGFGSYKHLYGLILVNTGFAHLLVALGIALGIITGTDNIYTAPEFFGGSNGRNWFHVLAHVFAVVIVPLIAWLIGSVILFITKSLKPAR
jgi:hypothetical protein